MPIPTRATLKSYFETADQPTQVQFAALVDAIYDLSQFAIDESEAAVAAAEAIAAASIKASGFFRLGQPAAFTYPTFPAPVIYRENGCTIGIVQVDGSLTTIQATITVTLDVPAADAFYPVKFYSLGAGNGQGTLLSEPVLVALTAKTAAAFSAMVIIPRNNVANDLRYFMFEAMA